ncbi:creatininase family protein [uncultured Castellaniella sp.]|uniref:creatininase family protein n=1 Tax=uncultured Castellaniella sp. TaxID=647907 RepID=UPI002620DC0D|nr:creatininase family protein [uncultured Castellaniella sp.]
MIRQHVSQYGAALPAAPRPTRRVESHRLSSGLRRILLLGCLALAGVWHSPASHAQSSSVYLEDLTSPELRSRIAAGATTILIPVGGTEQSGPNIALGKHNARARILAGRIAQALGNTIVAPAIAYVPEGSITPPAAHMRFAGTISVPAPVFEAVLESAARSFRQHGFRDIFFLGDHGGYQRSLEKAATQLNHEWAQDPCCRAYALLDYYQVTQTAYVDALKKRGYSAAEIGTHAGLADTSLSLALDPDQVRASLLPQGSRWTPRDGVYGDPTRASAELGRIGVRLIVDASVAAIRKQLAQHASSQRPSAHK